MAKFSEEKLEQPVIDLLEVEGYEHVLGQDISRAPTVEENANDQ